MARSTMLIMCSLVYGKNDPWPLIVTNRWSNSRLSGQIVFQTSTHATKAKLAKLPSWLSPQVSSALIGSGIQSPYTHQLKSWELLRNGINTVVATPTASGKTLCYNVPILNTLSEAPDSRALYLFPTKALSRDQEESVQKLARASNLPGKVMVYDGDTSSGTRRIARKEARILITNPDMLHMGILPHHATWATFFAGLSFVVIDELHTYRGVFGSHVANVMRRLNRIVEFYQTSPVFVASSATISNPLELAETVAGKEFELIEESGAPQGAKTTIVYNPELVDPDRGIRRSVLKESAKLAGDLTAVGRKTLVFCQTRQGVELVLRYLRERMTAMHLDPSRIRGYRGGYLPSLRREIETALRNGELDAVVATNALELGIDIGSLDGVIMAGYPGTIAGFRQRSGRAGRRQGPSLSVLVTSANPLDQFLARNPHYLREKSPERALVQPNNVEILLPHVLCAAFELPFSKGDTFGNLSVADTVAVLDCLEDEEALSKSKNCYYYVGDSYPAANLSLRNIQVNRVVVIDKDTGEAISEVDLRVARTEVHPGAIYMSEGQTYHVDELDLESKTAHLSKVEASYYTRAIIDAELRVIEEQGHRSLPGGVVVTGDVKASESITGFKKIRFHTHENLGYGNLILPSEVMETEATWLVPSKSLFETLNPYGEVQVMRGLDGLGYALHQVAALRLMCDPRDISFVVQVVYGTGFQDGHPPPLGLFFYDSHMGGVGISAQAFEQAEEILRDARTLISGCVCTRGCPSCIGPLEPEAKIAKEVSLALVCGFM
jgi:DEAD/DEAH box helicase domain-containing protein